MFIGHPQCRKKKKSSLYDSSFFTVEIEQIKKEICPNELIFEISGLAWELVKNQMKCDPM